jgi:DNA polymerase III alpha subunit
MGVQILPPDAALSGARLALEPNTQKMEEKDAGEGEARRLPWAIMWGLGHLPGWSIELAERFVEVRPEEGIGSLRELVSVAVRAGLSEEQVEALVRAGAGDRLGGKARDRDEMAERVPGLMAAEREGGEAKGKQRDLFSAAAEVEGSDEEATYQVEPLSPRERYLQREWERHHLGVGFTDAPEMDVLQEALDRSGALRERLLTTMQVGSEGAGKSVLLVGLLSGIKLLARTDEKGESAPLATAQLEDGEGSIELVAFPPNYARHKSLWTEGNAVIVTARVAAHDDGEMYLLCEHMAPMRAGDEEEEIKVKVKPSRGMRSAKGAVEGSVEIAAPKNGEYGAASGGNGIHSTAAAASHATGITAQSDHYGQPIAANGNGKDHSNGTGASKARYQVIITLPNVDDDHEAIDAMIALNSTLGEHPGEDIVTVRIPYMAGSQRMATVQLPRGVAFTYDLRERLESAFSPQALAVIELG